MAGSGDHIKALVRSHASGDDSSFYAVASQVAAHEARRGHTKLARELKETIDSARAEPAVRPVTSIAQPRGDLAELVTAIHPRVGLRDLVAPDQLIQQVEQVISEQRQRSALLERGFEPIHRLLLEGPSGTGKTMTAAVLASELSLPLLTVRLDALLSKFLGETSGKLRVVFDAIKQQRAVYLFDEFDALGADRSGNDVGEARRILNSFLVFVEEAGSESVVVAATNHISLLDRALSRRFDMTIHYDLPDQSQGRRVVKRRLGPLGRKIRFDRLSVPASLSHADLVKAAEVAAKAAVMRGDDYVEADELRHSLATRQASAID